MMTILQCFYRQAVKQIHWPEQKYDIEMCKQTKGITYSENSIWISLISSNIALERTVINKASEQQWWPPEINFQSQLLS